MSAASSLWAQKIWNDLQPTPGRLSSSLRIVLTTIIALILFMTLRVPDAFIGLFFVFIVGRDSPSTTFRTGMLIMLTLVAAVATELLVVILSDNDPIARVLGVSAVAFVAALLTVTTTLPAFPPIWGFLFCTLIALWEVHAPAGTLVKNSLWFVAACGIPILCSIAIEYAFRSRSPVDILQEERRTRYQVLGKMFALYAQEDAGEALSGARLQVIRLAAAGQAAMQRLYDTIVDRNLDPGDLPVGVRVRISMLAELMDVSAAFSAQFPVAEDAETRKRCARIADLCHTFSQNLRPAEKGEIKLRMGVNETLLDRVEEALQNILSMPPNLEPTQDRKLIALPSNKVPFFIPGSFSNIDNIAFALKLCLCATVCYVIYFAVDWPGISTAVITVFITGLSTSGAIKQKFIYRLLGSVIGGLIFGLGSAIFLFPYMDSITSLVTLVAAVCFIATWVAGGRIFNYVGLQIALSFYFVALEGFGAPTRLAPPRDRLVGILLALIVMWFVFDRIWPVRTVTVMRRTLAAVLQNDAKLFRLGMESTEYEARLEQADMLRDRIGKTVASLRTMSDEVAYEFGENRALHIHSSEIMLRAAFSAVALFWNEFVILHAERDKDFLLAPHLIALRREVAERMEKMAESVAHKEAYLTTGPIILPERRPLETLRYEEYANNVASRFNDLQESIASLGVKV
jgi:multidrug resistance protein MdtO